MKLSSLFLPLIAVAALLGVAAMPALAAPVPVSLGIPSDPVLELTMPAQAPELQICELALVEHRASCSFAVMASADCPAEVVASANALGPRVLASSAFLVDCLKPASSAPS